MSLAVESLHFSYCTRTVLDSVSFSASDGALLAVLGPNGVGKTTLFRCILGLQKRYTGKILLDGDDVRAFSPRQLAHRVAYIPQLHGAAFGYTVLDMTLMGASHTLSPFSVPGRRQKEAAMDALTQMGIDGLAEKVFSHLSGGEQQLVLIARALAQQAKTLLMDEPTASLDYGNQARVLSAVRALADGGYTVLLSTHNPQQALWYADTALALESGGRVEAFGTATQILDAALIERLYGMPVTLTETASGALVSPAGVGRKS